MSGFNYSGGSVADPGHESFDFDNIANRALDHCRKWDAGIVRGKYPDTPDDFIPMWIADMDFAAAPCIRAALRELSENGAYGYTYPYREFVDSIVGWQARRHGAEVRSEWVKNTYGTVPTIHYLYQAFCQPNDKVILNTPVYDPFGYAAHNNGIRVVCNPLAYDGGEYSIDFDLLERQLDTERPRVMLFCSPHNPGGRTWTLTEIEQVAELCERYGVLFVVDEVQEISCSPAFIYRRCPFPGVCLTTSLCSAHPIRVLIWADLKRHMPSSPTGVFETSCCTGWR